MARAVASNFERRASYEPLYDFDPRTEASVEVFYADQVFAKSFDTRPGWFWWTCRPAVQQAGSALCRGPVHLPDGASADHAEVIVDKRRPSRSGTQTLRVCAKRKDYLRKRPIQVLLAVAKLLQRANRKDVS